MRSNRIRLQIAVLIFILLPAATGVIAVHASATCERFVRTYVTKPVKNHVSQATLAAWAAWREAHPDWKPNPDVHRPKYVMTREEQVKKVDFACEVPEIPQTTRLFVKTASVDPPPAMVDFPHMTQETMPQLPQLAEVTPWPPVAAFVPPVSTPSVSTPIGAPTPEPMPIVLVISGVLGFAVLRGMRRLSPAA
ncbi:MAG TPA: hypothetical protein VG714_02155 [Acidobacteriaceae bacterium]|nr:hypothetical protein [Acidobacteriaceae bacterium]